MEKECQFKVLEILCVTNLKIFKYSHFVYLFIHRLQWIGNCKGQILYIYLTVEFESFELNSSKDNNNSFPCKILSKLFIVFKVANMFLFILFIKKILECKIIMIIYSSIYSPLKIYIYKFFVPLAGNHTPLWGH